MARAGNSTTRRERRTFHRDSVQLPFSNPDRALLSNRVLDLNPPQREDRRPFYTRAGATFVSVAAVFLGAVIALRVVERRCPVQIICSSPCHRGCCERCARLCRPSAGTSPGRDLDAVQEPDSGAGFIGIHLRVRAYLCFAEQGI